jgi:putative glutamine amidotransferase
MFPPPLPHTDRPARRPLVLVPACNKLMGDHPFHVVGRKYVDAVRLAGALPLVVPRAERWELDELLDLADGVMLTGSPSNVHPSHFDEPVHDASLPLDPVRDAWTLPLIPLVLSRGMPLLAICRGTQETNVALGGSLHQAVHQVGPYRDHRAPADEPAPVQYGPSHTVAVAPGGRLESILGTCSFEVNSVHGQGIHRLAPGARIEATAPDGLVEAFSISDAPGFNLCVQWHPEWRASDNPESRRLFEAFGAALCNYRDRVRGPLPA